MANPLSTVLKSFAHNIVAILVGYIIGFIGTRIDSAFSISRIHSNVVFVVGLFLVITGFALRFWATLYFYRRKMKVISLVPQDQLITTGPYKFSRNPLYLGGNVFIFFGASLTMESPSGIIICFLQLVFVELLIKREERQLEAKFGPEWISYKQRVRRWF